VLLKERSTIMTSENRLAKPSRLKSLSLNIIGHTMAGLMAGFLFYAGFVFLVFQSVSSEPGRASSDSGWDVKAWCCYLAGLVVPLAFSIFGGIWGGKHPLRWLGHPILIGLSFLVTVGAGLFCAAIFALTLLMGVKWPC
jgi:hypothetical protein